MPSIASRAGNAFLDLFRPRAPVVPPDLEALPELGPADYMANREIYPVYPLSGWSPGRIIEMLNSHDQGNFTASELFYHALRKEGLIGAALEMFRESVLEFASTLQCPKDAPKEIHEWVEVLARDWQSVMPDDVRGEIIERTRMFGFCICRLQWTWNNGQRQPIFIPFTQSSTSWRQDLYCYQVQTEDIGIEYVSNDGREWVIFSLGGTRPWLGGIIRQLAFVYFGIITGDDRWLNFNDKFAEPVRIQYTPRLTREQPESQRLYQKVQHMRGGDLHLQPREGKDTGYDFRYEQVNAQGYETLKEQLDRFDMRACIIILGHNLLQQVKGGSLAAMKEAKGLLRTKAIAALRRISTACEPCSKVWARANFGNEPGPNGRTPEQDTWSLIYDTSDPDLKELAAKRAQSYSDAFDKFFAGLAAAADAYGDDTGADILPTDDELAAGDVIEGEIVPPAPPLPAKKAPKFLREVLKSIDWYEAAERCGLPMLGGEESYSQDDDDEAELQAAAKRKVLAPRAVRLLPAPTATQTTTLASGDSADSAAGLIEGQQQIDAMADQDMGAPALAAVLAALAEAPDYEDLQTRLAGIVGELDVRDDIVALADRLHIAEHIGTESVDHDLPASARVEVDAADRSRSQAHTVAELRQHQERSRKLATAATSYAVYAVARQLWDAAGKAAALGHPLEAHKGELADHLRASWDADGAAWRTARAEPLQRAFTHGRARRLSSEALTSIHPYWRLDAILDGNTTPLCRRLNGLVMPAGSPGFPIPPLHWGCRTTVRGLSRAEGERLVRAAPGNVGAAGFGEMGDYPAPESGPEPLIKAYRARVG